MDFFVSKFNIYLEDNGNHYVYNTIDSRFISLSNELLKFRK